MAPTAGILYVTMQPQASLPSAEFHDWYDNEHGPSRLRLPFVQNGFRYRATDLDGDGGTAVEMMMPEWMAIYDVSDTAELAREPYTRLRTEGVQSQRERDVMSQIKVDRRILDLVESREVDGFSPLEAVKKKGGKEEEEAEGNVLVAVSLSLYPGKARDELDRWYGEEHISMLSKIPGWRRTRRFVTSLVQGTDEIEYLALHEYAPRNGLGGEAFKAATSTPWQQEIMTNLVREKRRRTYELYYTFGAAPRDLSALSSVHVDSFISTDGRTWTVAACPEGSASISSYVTTKDGVILPYSLEGSSEPDAPLIVLSNSILVDWGIWDGFVRTLLYSLRNWKYRILRYHTRGRSGHCGDGPITLDVLAADVIALLDALRVHQAAALIGVSLGGATALNTALKYPERVAAFVSCDTNAKSPETNEKAWKERIAVAEKEGAKRGPDGGATVVGKELAESTVNRWFATSGDGQRESVKAMVENNSLDGFKKSVAALYDYDLRAEMRACRVKGAFVVGSGDGALPGAMKQMAAEFGDGQGHGAEFAVIDGAGHLPMVERPEEFTDFVIEFLAGESGID
ncbi:MAG: hypothetical protein M1837_003034 [Sclerophora amabilis]|nr:MAG: hypothetical protein M1837_003034 [Sclerophora amabilis]